MITNSKFSPELTSARLQKIFQHLLNVIGPRHWWPGDGALEIIIGAILTQNTAWKNVEKAISELKKRNLLSISALDAVELAELASVIRSSGYYNQKAKKIKHFIRYLIENYGGSLQEMEKVSVETLRQELLQINGIGAETADSILLYALNKPTFVIDAYTHRIFQRHQWTKGRVNYEELRQFFLQHLPQDLYVYNEFHALIDYVGHHFCRREPNCEICPLKNELPQQNQMKEES